ncbi:MAG: hypothetical protein ACFFDN_51830 [Candidatus Hodarchaeota archaeon]
MPQPFDHTGTYLALPYYWRIPAGQTTLALFQDLMPSLRYETFYNMDYFPGIINLGDNYVLSSPIMDNWTLYQRMDLYTRPKAGEQILYQFTKDFLVKPRRPDLHTGYGMYGAGGMSSMFGFSGISTDFLQPF